MSGLKLREILALDTSPIKFSTYLVYSTSLSLLSIIALAFSLCTLMTAIAVCSLLYTTYASIKIFRLVSDTQMCIDIILEEHQSRGDRFINNYVYRWLDEYEHALQNNSLSELNHYSKLLNKCTTDRTSCALIQRHLADLLVVACKNMSFEEAVSWVFDKTGFSVQAESICENYIRRVQFSSADELLRFDIPWKIQSLINNGLSIHQSRAINLSYFLIARLIDNERVGSTKLEMLDSCLRIITSFPFIQEKDSADSSVEDIDGLKQQLMSICLKNASKINKGIILRVFVEKVLLDHNSIGDVVYEKLITYLYVVGACHRNSVWTETIACMYEYCYLLGYKSNQIDQDKKKRIIGLVTRHDHSLWDIVRDNITHILTYYIDCEINMDYIPVIILDKAISMVDSVHFSKDDIGFAYTLYLASPIASLSSSLEELPLGEIPGYLKPYKDYRFPLLQYLDKMDKNLQRACTAILKKFDPNTGTITEECMENVLDLQRMNGERFPSMESINRFKGQTIDIVFQAVCAAMQSVSLECSK